jgi:uncharacterized protein
VKEADIGMNSNLPENGAENINRFSYRIKRMKGNDVNKSPKRKKWLKIALLGCGLISVIMAASCSLLRSYGEAKFLSTGPNGTDTPEKYGAPYERVKIASGTRKLDGYLVKATKVSRTRYALLIFHGAGETISDWAKAQSILYNNGISSLVFDYSGHGNSSRPGSIKNLNEDARAAYAYFISRFPGNRIGTLGFSLGNAPMLASIKSFQPVPNRVIVASAFSTLLELGKYSGKSSFLYKILSFVVPDDWNNVKAVKENTAPLLVVHSDSDKSNPLFMGQKIFRAAGEPKKFLLLHGFQHNAPIRDSSGTWWLPIIDYIKEEKN